jgi:hypothetical protein
MLYTCLISTNVFFQRRKLEREAKTKKIGTHFYATANVKNKRNR